MRPNDKLLRALDANPPLLVAAEHRSIDNRPMPSELHQCCGEMGFTPLLPLVPAECPMQTDIGLASKREPLPQGSRRRTVVPMDLEQWMSVEFRCQSEANSVL